MVPIRKTHFHTISNPDTNTIISMLHGALQGTKSTSAGIKIVHIGIDKLHVTISEMDPLNGKPWKTTSCYDNLDNTMRTHMDNLSIPDLVTVMST